MEQEMSWDFPMISQFFTYFLESFNLPSRSLQACSRCEVISGWSWKYVQLAPSQSFNLSIKDSEQGFLKLIRGTVLDVNQIGVQMLG